MPNYAVKCQLKLHAIQLKFSVSPENSLSIEQNSTCCIFDNMLKYFPSNKKYFGIIRIYGMNLSWILWVPTNLYTCLSWTHYKTEFEFINHASILHVYQWNILDEMWVFPNEAWKNWPPQNFNWQTPIHPPAIQVIHLQLLTRGPSLPVGSEHNLEIVHGSHSPSVPNVETSRAVERFSITASWGNLVQNFAVWRNSVADYYFLVAIAHYQKIQ